MQSIDTGGTEFAEVARERGLLYAWPRQPRPMSIRDAFGCGCAAFDYDNDGWQDVLLVADPHPVLYRNLGGGNFKEVTEQSGLSGQAYSVSVAHRPSDLCGMCSPDSPTRKRGNFSAARRLRVGLPTAGAQSGRARAPRGFAARRRTETRQGSDWTGVAVGDFDADGWLDVLLTGFQRLALLKKRRRHVH